MLGQSAEDGGVADPVERDARDRRSEDGRADPDDEGDEQADRQDDRDGREGGEQVATSALAADHGRFERSPCPFRPGDGRAVDDGEQATKAEQEAEDQVVRTREGDKRQRVTAAVRAGSACGRDGEVDHHEQAGEQAEGEQRGHAGRELLEARNEESHDWTSMNGSAEDDRSTLANRPSRSVELDSPVSVRNNSSRSLPMLISAA